MPLVAFYVRVSTKDQKCENQLQALREYAKRQGWHVRPEHIYIEQGISGAKSRKDRPQFNALCEAMERGEFQSVAAWSVDRLGRSLIDLIEFLSLVHKLGVNLYLHQQGIDTTTPMGKAMFQVMGVFAEFERQLIRERIAEGMARVKAEGKVLGAKKTIMPEVEAKVLQLRAKGYTCREVKQLTGVSLGSMARILKKNPLPSERPQGAETAC